MFLNNYDYDALMVINAELEANAGLGGISGVKLPVAPKIQPNKTTVQPPATPQQQRPPVQQPPAQPQQQKPVQQPTQKVAQSKPAKPIKPLTNPVVPVPKLVITELASLKGFNAKVDEANKILQASSQFQSLMKQIQTLPRKNGIAVDSSKEQQLMSSIQNLPEHKKFAEMSNQQTQMYENLPGKFAPVLQKMSEFSALKSATTEDQYNMAYQAFRDTPIGKELIGMFGEGKGGVTDVIGIS